MGLTIPEETVLVDKAQLIQISTGQNMVYLQKVGNITIILKIY